MPNDVNVENTTDVEVLEAVKNSDMPEHNSDVHFFIKYHIN